MISDSYVPIRVLLDALTTVVSFNFEILAEANIRVYLEHPTTGVQTQQTSGITVVFDDDTPGGTVTFDAAHDGYYCVIGREIPKTQEVDYTTSGGIQAAVLEASLDAIIAMIQDVREHTERALLLPLGQTGNLTLPVPSAGKALIWNATEDGFDNTSINLADLTTALASALAAAASASASSSSASASASSASTSASIASAAASSIPGKASEVEAEAGSENTKYMTALRTAQAIEASVSEPETIVVASGTVYQVTKNTFLSFTITQTGLGNMDIELTRYKSYTSPAVYDGSLQLGKIYEAASGIGDIRTFSALIKAGEFFKLTSGGADVSIEAISQNMSI